MATTAPPPTIDLETGDRIVLGFGPEGDAITGPVRAAVFISRAPESSPPHVAQPGLRRTTVRHVRAVIEARDLVAKIGQQFAALRRWIASLFVI